jgi:hypothetical protein
MLLVRHSSLGLLSSFVILVSSFSAPAQESLRAERVGWARLKTPSEWWMRHATGDPVLMHFIRENTSLNIDPTWYVAGVDNLKQMCAYPLLFSQGVQMIEAPSSRANLAEYVRRGGFLLIDSCINKNITPDPDVFLLGQQRFLAEALPEARVVPLPPEHEIYRCFFQIPDHRPPHTFDSNIFNPRWARHGLYGIMIGQRMVGLISLSGLQCGWDRMIAPPGHDVACMKMLVNIYICAMAGGGK